MKSNVFISILFLLSTSTAFAAEQVAEQVVEQGGDYGDVTRVLGRAGSRTRRRLR